MKKLTKTQIEFILNFNGAYYGFRLDDDQVEKLITLEVTEEDFNKLTHCMRSYNAICNSFGYDWKGKAGGRIYEMDQIIKRYLGGSR